MRREQESKTFDDGITYELSQFFPVTVSIDLIFTAIKPENARPVHYDLWAQPTNIRPYIHHKNDRRNSSNRNSAKIVKQPIYKPFSWRDREREMRKIRHVLDRYNVIPNGKCQFLLSNEMEQFQTSKPIFVTIESVYGFRLEFLFFFYFYLISYID